ncbi:alpha/beta hydrolase [Pedobacter sp. PLR]|uniref:alpha/beta fold hydrolase n=1 Tax=Pedobacter sp. PLR TaxID=2994465 RepID=UPI002247201A|nr:alpha/beta hydrolase [Pedobacter sp. PLR]MCX2454150.1 alpha/beta hydrolase [Pedobacter sp. PLR]
MSRILLFSLAVLVSSFSLKAQNTTTSSAADTVEVTTTTTTTTKPDLAAARKLYQQAQKEFALFETQHGGFVQTKNVNLHYLSWGKPSGIPLIWSHGSLTNGYELLKVADDLVKAGYYLIAIDYYGHGQTAIPAHPVSLYHVADDIAELMDQLKIKKAVIGGWSRGGGVSTAFYDAYPERVLGLILEDGGSVAQNTHYHKMEASQLEKTIKTIMEHTYKDTLYTSAFDAYYDIYDPEEGGTQFSALAWIRKAGKEQWGIYPGVMELFQMNSAQQWSDLILRPTKVTLFGTSMSLLAPEIIYRNLNVPMLILDPASKEDFMPFEKENAALQAQHPKFIEHKIYENTGHNIHYEQPKRFVQDLSGFLKRVKASP